MAPPFVKPYIKSQKNDANDAEGKRTTVRGRRQLCGTCPAKCLRDIDRCRGFSRKAVLWRLSGTALPTLAFFPFLNKIPDFRFI
jgi:hypothetical protein